MIKKAQRRLILLSTGVILVFNLAVLVVVEYYLVQNMIDIQRQHILEEVSYEFLPNYQRDDLSSATNWDPTVKFQLLNKQGKVVGATMNSRSFSAPLRKDMMARASSGETVFFEEIIENVNYLIAYFYLDKNYVGLAATNLEMVSIQRRNFALFVLAVSPGVALLSFLVSRFLVLSALKPVSEGFALQRTFSENLAHELMSPLTGLKGNLEVTLRHQREPKAYQQTIQENLQEVNRLIDLLEGLELLGQGVVTQEELNLQSCNLMQQVQDKLEDFHHEISQKQITLEVTGKGSQPCKLDISLVGLALRNLVENAAKYTPKKGSIQVQVFQDVRRFGVKIENDCNSVGAENLSTLLEPFVRGKNISTPATETLHPEEGTHRSLEQIRGKGLGLHLAHHIARAHGGGLDLDTPVIGRFSATIWFPKKRSARSA